MKLTRNEENKLVTQGILAVASCLILSAAIPWTIKNQAEKIKNNNKSTMAATEAMLESNRNESRQNRFLRENSKTIESMWSTLKGWGDGVKPSNVIPLNEAGLQAMMPIAPKKIPGNPLEYSGLRISGDKTEFQRMLDALSKVESDQALLQVSSANLSLPEGTPPNAERPTFLNIQIEVVAPSSK